MSETPSSEVPEIEEAAELRHRRGWLPIVVIVVAVGIMAFVFAGRFGNDPRLVDSPLIGKPLAELTIPYLEQDGALTLSDLKGQILVINFWASWCFPCRAEHPVLTVGAAEYADKGVHFVGISYQDRRSDAIAFLDEFGRSDNYSYVTDEHSAATVELGVFGVPETYFVDADGIIRGKVQGQITQPVLYGAINAILEGRNPDL